MRSVRQHISLCFSISDQVLTHYLWLWEDLHRIVKIVRLLLDQVDFTKASLAKKLNRSETVSIDLLLRWLSIIVTVIIQDVVSTCLRGGSLQENLIILASFWTVIQSAYRLEVSCVWNLGCGVWLSLWSLNIVDLNPMLLILGGSSETLLSQSIFYFLFKILLFFLLVID